MASVLLKLLYNPVLIVSFLREMYVLVENRPFYHLLLSVRGTLMHLPTVDLQGPETISLVGIVVERSSIYSAANFLSSSRVCIKLELKSPVSIMSHKGCILLTVI